MTLKCTSCGNKIETLFLEKIQGTYVRKGKNLTVLCSACQKKFKEQVKPSSS